MKYLLLILLTVNTAFGQVKHIKKGEAAPNDGYFITYEQEKKFRQLNEENKQLKATVIQLKDLQLVQERQLSVLEERLKLQQDHNKFLNSQIDKSRSDGFWNKTFHFVSGAVVMGAATYIATKVNK